MAEPLHFVLDQNYPIAPLSIRWPTALQLSRLAEIAPELVRDHEDWEIVHALNQRGDVTGFVTNDADMLELPREMVVLNDSQLTLVITDGVGHDPIRATGLLMVHLQEIARRVINKPQIFVLRPRPLQPLTSGSQLDKLADRQHIQTNRLISQERAVVRELLRRRR